MANSPLEDAIAHYREKLNNLEKAARISQPSPQMVLAVLIARDEIEVLKTDQPGSAAGLLDLSSLDKQLQKHHELIVYIANREKWSRKIQIQSNKWWWKLVYSPCPFIYLKALCTQGGKRKFCPRQAMRCLLFCPRLFLVTLIWVCDRFDPLWKVGTIGLVIGSLSLAANIAPRFFAGGPSAEGALAIIAPSVISLILGKETLDQLTKGQGGIEKFLERVRFIPRWSLQEVALILSGLMFWGLYRIEESRLIFAECYYERGMQIVDQAHGSSEKLSEQSNLCQSVLWLSQSRNNEKQPSTILPSVEADLEPSTMLSSAEADLERAIALNPNYAKAHFQLGWLYELRQDVELARTKYKIAMQNGSLLARIRLARIYLLEGKESSTDAATNILLQAPRSAVEKFPDKEIQKSWYTAMGWARLQQKRYEDAKEELNKANQIHEELKKSIHAYDQDPKRKAPTTFYCVRAELFEKLNDQASKKQKLSDQALKQQWEKCADWSNPRDLDEDWWLTKAKQKLKY